MTIFLEVLEFVPVTKLYLCSSESGFPHPLTRRRVCTHCKDTIPKIRNKYSQERNCVASVPISIFMCLWAIYIFPCSVCLFCCKKIYGPILGIYKLLTDTRMWTLGLRPRKSFSGNTLMGFLLQCAPIWFQGEGTLACERGGGGPNSNEEADTVVH
jgi:hypothetical protein